MTEQISGSPMEPPAGSKPATVELVFDLSEGEISNLGISLALLEHDYEKMLEEAKAVRKVWNDMKKSKREAILAAATAIRERRETRMLGALVNYDFPHNQVFYYESEPPYALIQSRTMTADEMQLPLPVGQETGPKTVGWNVACTSCHHQWYDSHPPAIGDKGTALECPECKVLAGFAMESVNA